MAGRIRSIKPEILEDEKAAKLSDAAWRLWVSLWLIADDYGNARGDSRRLAADIWWCHDSPPNVSDILREIETAGFLTRYEVRGQKYVNLKNWNKHQRIDNAGKARVPGPSEAESLGESPRDSEIRGSDLDLDHEGTPKGKGVASVLQLVEPPQKQTRAPKYHPDAPGVLTYLNQKRQEINSGATGFDASEVNLRHISDRLNDGKTVDQCKRVIDVKARECRQRRGEKDDPWKYFNAITPFRPEPFEMALGQWRPQQQMRQADYDVRPPKPREGE
jgi:hypothetical protein